MLNVLVVGYGNVGRKAVQAVLAAPDLKLVAIQDREIDSVAGLDVPVVRSFDEVKEKINVAILCVPSRVAPQVVEEFLLKGINTVDCFDVHSEIRETREKLDKIAKRNGVVSILSAGWDPGSDSVIRALMTAMLPSGITHTNFGPGMSMGHSVAAKAIAGVDDAVSITVPMGTGIHRRMVYVQIQEGADFEQIAKNIKNDPYFVNDETHVRLVADINEVKDASHGVHIERIGRSSSTNNQRVGYQMTVDNPALTSQIMVSCARACVRQKPGCYTMIEVAPVDYLPGNRRDWVEKLV